MKAFGTFMLWVLCIICIACVSWLMVAGLQGKTLKDTYQKEETQQETNNDENNTEEDTESEPEVAQFVFDESTNTIVVG